MSETKDKAIQMPHLEHSMGGHLGIEFTLVEEGLVKATMPVDHRTCQPYGVLNGGASIALAEMVAGHGSVPLCTPGEMPCGIQVSANHLRMVKVGNTVEATGTLVHRGRTMHIWNIDIKTTDGKLVSTVRVVNQIVKKHS